MNLFSRYRPRFVHSLVYMLQTSEYDARDYLAWYHRTIDFAHVEKRKSLVWTPKAKVLFSLVWAFIILWCVGVMTYVGSTGSDVPLVVGAGVVLLAPFYVPYVLAFLSVLASLAQRPVEYGLTRKARKRLATHGAIKIAIAGSYGKTSMREILKTVLAEGKNVAAPGGSENTPLAIARFVAGLTGNEDVLIFELGEYRLGDVRKLCKMIRPDLGIITGVNEAHLQKFRSLESAADTIFELAECVAPESLYVNCENDAARLQSPIGAPSYSRAGVEEWRVSDAKTGLDGTSFVLEKGNERINVHSKLLGLHHIGPLVAATAIAARLGVSVLQIQHGLSHTKPFAHRLERTDDASGAITLDDSYNGNPDGVRAVIEFLASLKGRRRWYVTPGLVEMGFRTESVHRDIGAQLAEAGIEKVVLIKNSVSSWIEEGLKKQGFRGEIIWFNDALTCYASLPRMTVSGDVVLLQNDWPDQYA